MKLIFDYLPPNISSLKIAFTVAIDDKCSIANNKIGAVIIDIKRSVSEADYTKLIHHNIMKYKYDAITSYELVKSYYIQ